MASKRTNFPLAPDVSSYMGPTATLLMTNDSNAAGCFVLVDSVIALGTAVGGSTLAPGDVACELARIAVIHLANVLGA
jgi:hypothetical protein